MIGFLINGAFATLAFLAHKTFSDVDSSPSVELPLVEMPPVEVPSVKLPPTLNTTFFVVLGLSILVVLVLILLYRMIRKKMEAKKEQELQNEITTEEEVANEQVEELNDQLNESIKEKQDLESEVKKLNGEKERLKADLRGRAEELKHKLDKQVLQSECDSKGIQTSNDATTLKDQGTQVGQQQGDTSTQTEVGHGNKGTQIGDNAETEIKKLQEKITVLTKEKNNANSQVEQLNSRLNELAQEKQGLEGEVEQLKKQQTDAQQKLNQVEQELAALTERHNVTIGEKDEEIQGLSEEKDNLEQKVEDLKEQIVELKAKEKDLLKREEKLSYDNTRLNKVVDFFTKESHLSRLLREQVNNLKVQLHELVGKEASLLLEKEEAELRVKKLVTLLRKREDEIFDLKSKLKDQEEGQNELRKELKNQEKTKCQLEKDLAQTEEQLKEAQKRRDLCQDEIKRLEEFLNQVRKRNEELENKNSIIAEDREEQNRQLQLNNSTLEEENSRLGNENQELLSKILVQEKEILSLNNQHGEYESVLHKNSYLKGKIKSLEKHSEDRYSFTEEAALLLRQSFISYAQSFNNLFHEDKRGTVRAVMQLPQFKELVEKLLKMQKDLVVSEEEMQDTLEEIKKPEQAENESSYSAPLDMSNGNSSELPGTGEGEFASAQIFQRLPRTSTPKKTGRRKSPKNKENSPPQKSPNTSFDSTNSSPLKDRTNTSDSISVSPRWS